MSVFILSIAILIFILFLINFIIAPYLPDTEKLSPFECGILPLFAQTRTPITIKFYLVALLFLVFDLEISLLFPFSSYLIELNIYGFFIAVLFFLILTVGFFVEIASGVLYFTNQQSNPLYSQVQALFSSLFFSLFLFSSQVYWSILYTFIPYYTIYVCKRTL